MPLLSPGWQTYQPLIQKGAIEAAKALGSDPATILTVAALETGRGRSVKGNNYFGIKGKGQNFTTHEFIDGKRVKMRDNFRAYGSPDESFNDFADLIKRRYPNAVGKSGPEFFQAMKEGGYATDPNYVQKLSSIYGDSANSPGAEILDMPQQPFIPPGVVAQAPPDVPAQVAAGLLQGGGVAGMPPDIASQATAGLLQGGGAAMGPGGVPAMPQGGAAGGPQQPRGLLQRFGDFVEGGMASPLTHMGIGLLSANGQAEGLQRGLQSFQRQQMINARTAAGRMRNERENRKMQAEARKTMAKQAGLQLLMRGGDKEQAGSLFLQGGESVKDTFGLINPQPKRTDDEREYERAVSQGYKGTFMDYMGDVKKPLVTIGGGPEYKTSGGKDINDLLLMQDDLEKSIASGDTDRAQVLTRGIDMKKREMSSRGIGLDALRGDDRMTSALSMAKRFNTIAEVLEEAKDVGPGALRGIHTELQTSNKFWPSIYQSINPPTDAQSAAAQLAASMKAFMGTALSGAAIPEAEWPTYQAMVPGLRDSKIQRSAKARELEATLKFLLDRTALRLGFQPKFGYSMNDVSPVYTESAIKARSQDGAPVTPGGGQGGGKRFSLKSGVAR